jgi:cell division protein FtsB
MMSKKRIEELRAIARILFERSTTTITDPWSHINECLDEIESLSRENEKLQTRNKALEQQAYLSSWDKHPDRMGK